MKFGGHALTSVNLNRPLLGGFSFRDREPAIQDDNEMLHGLNAPLLVSGLRLLQRMHESSFASEPESMLKRDVRRLAMVNA